MMQGCINGVVGIESWSWYYNMLQLVEILKMVLQFDITHAHVQLLHARVIDYVKDFEKYSLIVKLSCKNSISEDD